MSEITHPEEDLEGAVRLWWLTLAVGLLSIAAGILVLLKPSESLATIAVIVGIFVAIDGVIALVAALRGTASSRGLSALAGAFGLIVGAFLIRHPVNGITAVAMLVGLWLIAVGALRLVLSFDSAEHRGWRALVGAIELIAGIVIVSSPGIGLATLAILIGVSLIVNGIGFAVLGGMLHSANSERTRQLPHQPAAAH
jgi:uncharacterized membrane protein HdeD (DUF308 family)